MSAWTGTHTACEHPSVGQHSHFTSSSQIVEKPDVNGPRISRKTHADDGSHPAGVWSL